MEGAKSNETSGRDELVRVDQINDLNEFVDAFMYFEEKFSHFLDMGSVVMHASSRLTDEEYGEFCSRLGVNDECQNFFILVGALTEKIGYENLACKINMTYHFLRMYYVGLEEEV